MSGEEIHQENYRVDLSVVVPVFNEAPVLPEFYRRLRSTLDGLLRREGLASEMIAVDDGSSDRSPILLREFVARDESFRLIHHEVNRGQHEAVLSGFAEVRSPIIISIDADLQNPPEEIPRILEKLRTGYDLVATRRIRRQDSLSRRLASRLANVTSSALTRLYTKVPLHDVGCMLRGYQRGLVEAMLRAAKEPGAPAPFIPALALRCAGRVCEIDVEHAPRSHGRSHYSWLGLVDLHVRLLATLARRPGRR